MEESLLFKNYYKRERNKLDNLIEEFNNNIVLEESISFRENLEFFRDLNKNGKLIRGVLVNIGYSLIKEDNDYSKYLALAYEVFQTSVLIHDDIIDNDMIRRGVETIPSRNRELYKEDINDISELNHFSNSLGICMGDYGLFKSLSIISNYYKDDTRVGYVLDYFINMALDTVKGELLDVVLPIKTKNNKIDINILEDEIINVERLKTAYYTIVGPLVNGMILGGCDNNKINDITVFGEKVGIAFQIQDDILGIYSNKTGKNTASDIEEYKQTILYSYICNTEYKDEFLSIYGNNNIDEEDIGRVRELLIKSGARDYAVSKMNELYDEGLLYLDKITWIDEDKKNILKGFVEYLKNRDK